jgi:hypothetical protein
VAALPNPGAMPAQKDLSNALTTALGGKIQTQNNIAACKLTAARPAPILSSTTVTFFLYSINNTIVLVTFYLLRLSS